MWVHSISLGFRLRHRCHMCPPYSTPSTRYARAHKSSYSCDYHLFTDGFYFVGHESGGSSGIVWFYIQLWVLCIRYAEAGCVRGVEVACQVCLRLASLKEMVIKLPSKWSALLHGKYMALRTGARNRYRPIRSFETQPPSSKPCSPTMPGKHQESFDDGVRV